MKQYFFQKSVGTLKVLYSVPCLEVITDDFSVHVSLTDSDGSCIDWWGFFLFFFSLSLPLFFKGSLSWMMAATASLIDLSAFQGFSTNPQCALQQSPHHLSWGPKPQKLIYRSIIVFGRRRGLTGADQCGSQALWITICPLNSKSMT